MQSFYLIFMSTCPGSDRIRGFFLGTFSKVSKGGVLYESWFVDKCNG